MHGTFNRFSKYISRKPIGLFQACYPVHLDKILYFTAYINWIRVHDPRSPISKISDIIRV